MTDTTSPVESEINEHRETVTKYIEEVKALTVPSSMKEVVNRYLRDCDTFIGDLDKQTSPSASDLCDFQDRLGSLEVQHNKLSEDFQ